MTNSVSTDLMIQPEVKPFFDPATHTVSYVVRDPESSACAIIDPVLDFDYAAGRLSFENADKIIRHIRAEGLSLEWLIETHVHADHLSAAPYIQQQLGGRLGIGQNITVIQATFGRVFNEGTEFQRDGSQFDHLFEPGERYKIGSMTGLALSTPGHTPACMTHIIGDAAFVGDTLFMPDSGSARADFPGGDAGTLYDSIQRIFTLPDQTRLFICHDYGTDERGFAWESTVAEEKANNIHAGAGNSRDDFIKKRTERDRELDMPDLIIPSLQVNMRAGHFPPADDQGNRYLKVPIDIL
ncbi:MBL fold metallo-hydrolase [Aestuariispira insulae]|uniref:Glyoxylase-like metal-dependent hydrolase (Beta-lactamase superfamily II) n=1 Tax=Aestuariispira insulae TaxID=1461337 RepID=A0A3D9HXY9_9PROT|nr:MBL fold metallo-hydrolase [Aestuariispira insulae]RED54368.1 glyoxylase-like metal-dependent hydrolase (beta-lactamase superfamily II) [Aestuariispira insulae]